MLCDSFFWLSLQQTESLLPIGLRRKSGGFLEGGFGVSGEVVVVGAGVLGVGAAVLAVGFALDFGGRKNELGGLVVLRSVEGLGFHFVQVAQGYGFVEGQLAGRDAFGLELLELAERFFLRALQALLVEGQVDAVLNLESVSRRRITSASDSAPPIDTAAFPLRGCTSVRLWWLSLSLDTRRHGHPATLRWQRLMGLVAGSDVAVYVDTLRLQLLKHLFIGVMFSVVNLPAKASTAATPPSSFSFINRSLNRVRQINHGCIVGFVQRRDQVRSTRHHHGTDDVAVSGVEPSSADCIASLSLPVPLHSPKRSGVSETWTAVQPRTSLSEVCQSDLVRRVGDVEVAEGSVSFFGVRFWKYIILPERKPSACPTLYATWKLIATHCWRPSPDFTTCAPALSWARSDVVENPLVIALRPMTPATVRASALLINSTARR
jgi:hypothetical protein